MPWPTATPSPVDTVLVIDSPEWIAKRDQLLKAHLDAKDTLVRATESEMTARKELTKFLFPTPKVGTQRVALNNGFAMKLVHTETPKIKASTEAVEAVEDACAEVGNEGKFLVERIITWEPKFSKSEFNKLDTNFETHREVKKIIETIIETTTGAPQLTLEEPKKTL